MLKILPVLSHLIIKNLTGLQISNGASEGLYNLLKITLLYSWKDSV